MQYGTRELAVDIKVTRASYGTSVDYWPVTAK